MLTFAARLDAPTLRASGLVVLLVVTLGAAASESTSDATDMTALDASSRANFSPFSPAELLADLKTNHHYVWHALEASERGHDVIVHYLPGDETWAQGVLQTALNAIPVLERITGSPLRLDHAVEFWEVRQDDLGLAGINGQETGILLAPGQDVVIHELAHFWVGAHNLAEHWMAEGLADLYDHLARLRLEHRVWSPPHPWNLDQMCMFDGPLALWQRLDTLDATVRQREANRFFYGKAFVFWYALERVYGPEFVPALQAWIDSAKSPRDSSELLAFLDHAQKTGGLTIWDLYPGWLVQGNYTFHGKRYTLEWFLEDDDDDGVWNLEELLAKLDPENSDTDGDGLDDGWELATGGRPRIRDPRPTNGVWVLPQWTPVSSGRFVRAGESIRITARGLWRMAEPSRAWFGPEGLEPSAGDPNRWGELLARVGWGPRAGRIHRIGRGRTFTADRDGILYLFARGFYKQIGAGRVLVQVRGGVPLPDLRAGTRALRHAGSWADALRAKGITEVALKGKHVTAVVAMEDLEAMTAPDRTLAYLDDVYETYTRMTGDEPFGGRSILITFDVTLPDQILVNGNALVLTFGLSHLNAFLQTTGPDHASWGLTYGLAIPFLDWHRVDTLFEGKALWAMAELMATEYYEHHDVPVPALEQAKARLRTFRFSVSGPEEFETDKRLAWTFLNALRCDFGWKPYAALFRDLGTLDSTVEEESTLSTVPLEDFLLEFGRVTRVNLNERYHAWGFPITGRLRLALEPFAPPPEPGAE